MAFTVGDRVQVTDHNSEYRRISGTVLRKEDSTNYQVRLDGYGKYTTVRLREGQIAPDGRTAPYDYSA